MNPVQDNKIFKAAEFMGAHPLAGQIFRVVYNQVGVTGWQIVREVQKSPQEVEKTLSDLLNLEAVRADGQGLDGYYVPSGSAYAFGLRSRISG